ncbi:MAG: helix-turn-helix transcriptional regulator [Halococcoides sp.]
MASRAPLVVAVVLLSATLGGGLVAGAADGGEATLFAPPTNDYDRTTVTVRVAANGSTTITVAYVRTLANETAIDRFRSATPDILDRTDRLASRTADRIANATGRSATVAVLDRESRVATSGGLQTEGVRTIRVRMTGLARTTDAGVVFEVPIPIALGADQRLVVEAGPDLAVDRARPDPDRSSAEDLTYTGPTRIAAGDCTIRFSPAPGDAVATTPDRSVTPILVAAVVGGIVLGAVLATGWVGLRRWRGTHAAHDDRPGADSTPSSGDRDRSVEDHDRRTDDAEHVPGDPDRLPDAGRVERLLEAADGRMKQSAIVESTGWSKSKTSMVLSEMADEDRIVKLTVGRENIISLPEAVPDVVDDAGREANDD